MKYTILSIIISIVSLLKVSAQSNVEEAEYYFDADPGFGNGVSLPVQPSASFQTSYQVPVNNLSLGFHSLNMRIKNSSNRWSLSSSKSIYTLPVNESNCIAAEYFFDDDPGFHMATPIVLQNPTNQINQNFNIPIPESLMPGIHVLSIRVKNANQYWSLSGKKIFYLNPSPSNSEVVAIEYFFDEDPGFGLGFSLAVNPAQSIDLPVEISIPETLENGDHIIYMRVKDSNDRWSLSSSRILQIDNTIGIDENVQSFNLFPNPAHTIIRIENSAAKPKFASIFDLTGKLISEQSVNNESIQLEDLPVGTFLLRLRFDDNSSRTKLIMKE